MSINANELRISNLVSYKGEIKTVAELFGISNNSQWDSIPLTPEILIDCGFRHDDEDKEYQINYSIGLPIGNGSDLFIEFDPLFKGQVNVGIISLSDNYNYFNEIKYLHQLQNLIFSLSGQELIYNPQKQTT